MKKRSLLTDLLFVVYLPILLRSTVFRDGCFSHGWFSGRVEWVPFLYLAKLVRVHYWGYFIYLFVGNLAWFVPLGWYLHQRGKGFWLTLLLGALLSAGIEVLQFVLGSGVSEVEDVILNTFGTGIGYGLVSTVFCVRNAAKQRKRALKSTE